MSIIAFGPYTLEPGDDVQIVLAQACNGISQEMCKEVGSKWITGEISESEKKSRTRF